MPASILLQCCRRLAVEALLFALLPATFLIGYVKHFHAPTSAIWPHIQIVAILWGVLLLIRLLSACCFNSRQARLLGSFFMALALFSMLLYYSLVWTGLGGWGRVISADLIATYASQLPALCEVLGVPPAVAVIIVIGAFLLLWWMVCGYLRAWDWVPPLWGCMSRRSAILSLAALGAFLLVGSWVLVQFPPALEQEPISLTFFPDAGQTQLQSTGISRFDKLDVLEGKARKEYVPNPAAARRNVFVIVVDALRADHLGFNGYRRATSPHLDALAHGPQAEFPMRMYSACAESACGLMALSSSRLPHQFSTRPMTLPQVLMLHGYRAHMILGGDHTHFYGLKEAYGNVDTYYDGSMAKGRYMNDDRLVTSRLAEMPEWNGTPVFMQFHLMSAHGLGRRQPQFDRYQPARNVYTGLRHGISRTDAEANQSYVNFYDNGVLQTDDTVLRILQILEEKGYLKDSLVVVTADHGELLGEHGRYTHAKTIYEAVLGIPFLMLRYGYASGARVPRNVIASQTDIAPTVLQELDIPAPSSWTGLALQADSDALRSRRYIYFQQQAEYGLLDMGQAGVLWKYRVDAHDGTESANDVLRNRDELGNQLGELPGGLKAEWVRQLLGMQVAANGLASPTVAATDQAAH
jgi:glucan phosphoethanolaminetransferase (alkaline phosphatase superfamily)